jgi:hypothetical protein
MTCHHPSRMMQPPSGLNQKLAVCSSWKVKICSLFLFFHSIFFPGRTFGAQFCATFFQLSRGYTDGCM